MTLLKGFIPAVFCSLMLAGAATPGVCQPNALVPGTIAPYAPSRGGASKVTTPAMASVSTPNGTETLAGVARADLPTATSATPAYDYVLGPGDKLRIIVFDEEKVSGEFFIAGNGNLSLPLIGEVPAAGKTVGEVLADVTRKLQVYLKYPRVSAEVETFRPYYILGEVAKPGEYPYADGISVVNAIATAGGFTYRSDHNYVYIQRANQKGEQRVRLTGSLTLSPGDTVRVRERYF